MNIKLDDLYKRFGNRQVLKGMDLEVSSTECYVIIGRSGIGKSVTLKHMVGLLSPDRGKVIVDGQDLAHLSANQIRRIRSRFGYLFQSGALINWMNVEDNVALPLHEHTSMTDDAIQKRVRACLEMVDMEHAATSMPSELSGGMKKRAGLARAIIRDPEVVLYDEPTSGLDPVMTASINQLIRRLQQELKITSIVVTHDMTSAYYVGDRISMIYDGRIHYTGTPESIKTCDSAVVQQFIQGRLDGPLTEDGEAASGQKSIWAASQTHKQKGV